jgi:hypothetical protein
MRTALVVLSVLAMAALAGCSKAPPSGTLGNGGSGLTGLSGTADVAYQEAVYPAGQVPVVGPMACGPAGAPPQTQCVPASSSFHVHFMSLPTPEGTYDAVLAGGPGGERNLGSLAVDTGSMWDFNVTIPNEDLDGQFQRVEVRMGDFVLATAPATEGPQAFALADGLDAVQAAGSYKGKVLNVTVSGLPANGTYMGRLYTNDTQSGLLTVAESFPVHNGANEFTAKTNVADYSEFHIHVGTSLVNLYKMRVTG